MNCPECQCIRIVLMWIPALIWHEQGTSLHALTYEKHHSYSYFIQFIRPSIFSKLTSATLKSFVHKIESYYTSVHYGQFRRPTLLKNTIQKINHTQEKCSEKHHKNLNYHTKNQIAQETSCVIHCLPICIREPVKQWTEFALIKSSPGSPVPESQSFDHGW